MAKANGNAHTIVPLDASRLKIQLAETLKPIPTPGSYTFGDASPRWSAPEIKPYGAIPIDPSSNCLQYATNVFEGMKAILDPEGKPRMFRPRDNMQRLATSAARMALPPFDTDALLTCISKLVAIEARWIPALPDHSLYIRPTMIGTKPLTRQSHLQQSKSGPPTTRCSTPSSPPSGPTSPPRAASRPKPASGSVSLLAVSDHVRSWPGGTGGYKFGLNYSPGFVPQQAAAEMGYAQVLWLLGDTVTEAGAMNFWAVVRRADGGLTAITPPLDGTILPGITRDSALQLLRAHAAEPTRGVLAISDHSNPNSAPLTIEERPLTIRELARHAAAGALVECFGTGTAVLVVGIERIGWFADAEGDAAETVEAVGEAVLAAAEGTSAAKAEAAKEVRAAKKSVRDITMETTHGLGPVGRALWDKLLALKEGREDWAGWNVLCE
ncbi:aminotransferase [Mycena albidolilacea]|uniref:Aminotransferase n=1 Tax=Mycena albidolilacea TaxID=1033008 RepID=A0AAD6ZV97_9AGAR|nr:aminotransferase [Mycena albidolilacea]